MIDGGHDVSAASIMVILCAVWSLLVVTNMRKTKARNRYVYRNYSGRRDG